MCDSSRETEKYVNCTEATLPSYQRNSKSISLQLYIQGKILSLLIILCSQSLRSISSPPLLFHSQIEGWWTYEVCYGKQVTQFHQEGDQKTALFVLGKKTKHTRQKQLEQEKKEAEEAEEAERLGIPDDVPPGAKEYYIEDYEEGTKCDLSGEPRSVELHFYCSLSNRVGVITSIKEPRSCHYVVTVETSMLCSHPHYMKTEEKALPIVCVEGDQELLQQLRESVAADATELAPDDGTREDSVGGIKEDEGEEGGAERVVVIEASDPSEDDEFSSTL